MSRLDPLNGLGARYPDKDHPGFVRGSATSLAGANKIRRSAESLEDVVLSLLTGAGPDGLTDAEINAKARAEGIDSEMRPRRATLTARGYIIDSGKTRPNPTSGLGMTVWVLRA